LATHVVSSLPSPRQAALRTFRDTEQQVIDQGLVLFFEGPASYTGEDLVEFHTHGSPLLLARLVRSLLAAGARHARPGEFTERAFLNGKLDLVQAEAVADLISAGTEQALSAANRALAGDFSRAVTAIRAQLLELRAQLEALIDFADEEDVQTGAALSDLASTASKLSHAIKNLLGTARQGEMLGRSHRVVICGRPNAGKSTLMNALCGSERAIVTPTPGTTRDVLTAELEIEGLVLTIADTAGLRETDELIEREGIRRAHDEIANADLVLLVYEAGERCPDTVEILGKETRAPVIRVRNKIDLLEETASDLSADSTPEVALAARDRTGLELLRTRMLDTLGLSPHSDTPLVARERHLAALTEALSELEFEGDPPFTQDLVLTAERLRRAHRALGELLGEFTSEDLLGEIFGRFCIGK
jgi:tRNA modification GTPase